MAFLDDLLTFDGYICEGRKLDPDMLHHQITSRRSWLSRILQPAKTVESAEPEYWLHTTAAGFPLVLPHRKDGQLYTADVPSGATQLAHWYQNNNRIVLPSGFYLEANGEHREAEGAALLYCRTRKFFDLLPKTDYNFSVGEGITAAYTVTSQGEIISAEISYNFENDRDVSFIIYREEDSGKILTGLSVNLQLKFDFGPEGKPLVRAVDTDIHLSSSVNYERTLRNLVKILKKETFAGKDLTSLFNFHYQCASVSDIQVPDKTFLH